MDKLLKIIYDIFDLFYDFSMRPFRSVLFTIQVVD